MLAINVGRKRRDQILVVGDELTLGRGRGTMLGERALAETVNRRDLSAVEIKCGQA